MHQHALGTDVHLSAVGVGCMSVAIGHRSRPDTATMVDSLGDAIDGGVAFVDTAEIYSTQTSDELVGAALTRPDHPANRHATPVTLHTRPFPRVRS